MPRKLSLLLIAALLSALAWAPPFHTPPDSAAKTATAGSTPESVGRPTSSIDASVRYQPGLARADSSGPAVEGFAGQNFVANARPPMHSIEDLSSPRQAPVLQASTEPEAVPKAAPKNDPVPMGPVKAAAPESTPNVAPAPTPKPAPKPTPKPAPEPTPKPALQPTPKPAPEPPGASYSGTSRLWYPALGMSAAWKWYGCSYGDNPNGLGAGIYRWDCTPKSNVYLMSHAWSTFKAVKRGYHSGAMRIGQSVWYANNQGDVSQWRVKWIKRVPIETFRATFSEFTVNNTGGPIMTFQTCDGSNDQFRIMVRLVPAN